MSGQVTSVGRGLAGPDLFYDDGEVVVWWWCDGILENYENRMPASLPAQSYRATPSSRVRRTWSYIMSSQQYHCSLNLWLSGNRSLSSDWSSACKASHNCDVLNRSKLSSLSLYLHTERLWPWMRSSRKSELSVRASLGKSELWRCKISNLEQIIFVSEWHVMCHSVIHLVNFSNLRAEETFI